MVDKDINEIDFYSNQDISIDLETLYNNFINDIDAIRSRFSTPSEVNLTVLNDESISAANLSGKVNSDNVPQESRCNAFYRLCGLPIISKDGFYNPGYDPNFNTDVDAKNKRYSVANSLLKDKDLEKKFTLRETFPKSQLDIYAKQNEAASKLVYSIKYLRPIVGLIENDDPLVAEEQSFSFKERIEDALQSENFIYSGAKIPHILKPFMSDPRIDFLVRPGRNWVAVPFLTEKSRGNYKMPFLEKVARVRLAVRNQDTDLPALQTIIDNVKNNNDITDKKLIELTGGITKFYRSDVIIFNNLLKVFKIIVDSLFDSIKTIDEVQSKIHWIPIADPDGPEIGISSYPFISNDRYGMDIDKELDRLTSLKAINDNEIDLLKNDLGLSTNGLNQNQAFSSLDSIAFGSILSNVPTVYDERISFLTNRRNQLANKAAAALRDIAIVMGDTSGFGLVDMYCIYTAFWALDKTTLVNMFDDDAFKRLYSNSDLRSEEVEVRAGGLVQDPIVTAAKFQTKVKEVFNLFDALLKAKINNG